MHWVCGVQSCAYFIYPFITIMIYTHLVVRQLNSHLHSGALFISYSRTTRLHNIIKDYRNVIAYAIISDSQMVELNIAYKVFNSPNKQNNNVKKHCNTCRFFLLKKFILKLG